MCSGVLVCSGISTNHLCYIQIVFLTFDVKQQYCLILLCDLCVHFYPKKKLNIRHNEALPCPLKAVPYFILSFAFLIYVENVLVYVELQASFT